MQIYGLKSHIIQPNADLKKTIWQVFKGSKIKLKNGDILVISSKIISVCQGRMVKVKNKKEFLALVKKEADRFFGGKIPLTLKKNILIPQAGIDASNAPKGWVILWPKDPWRTVSELRGAFLKKFKMKKFGAVIADSHCQPLRWGTTGLALAFAGFLGVEDIRGKKDIFGKPLTVTRKAVADNLSSAALLVMGEANEKIPVVLIRNAPVKFTNRAQKKSEIFVSPENCLFAPVYKNSLL